MTDSNKLQIINTRDNQPKTNINLITTIMMKTKKILFGGLAALLMTACTNDMPDMDGNGQVTENETTTYVRVSLTSSMGTRAAEYENGSADENEVKKILLTFFDAGRNYVGKTEVTVTGDNTIKEDAGDPGSSTGLGNTVEKILTVVAPVTLPQNINYPKYVVAYVNPTSVSGDLATDKLEDAMNFIRNRSTVSYDGARTMNNSVYYSGNTGYVRFATEVDFKTNFFETEDAAMNATDAAIEITVERMEAKVRLSNDLGALSSDPIESDVTEGGIPSYTLEFVPEAWFVNGTEKRSFLIKNYRSQRVNFLSGNQTGTDFGMSLNDLQNAFKTNNTKNDKRENDVNDPTNLRSYWAIDPTYFTTADDKVDLYPDVSYDVKYGENINTDGKTYPLEYRSYTDVLKENKAANSTNYVKFNSDERRTHEYVLENTMSYNTLTGTDAKASMTSVVLLGHYVVKNGSGAVVFDGTTTDKSKAFYVRHEAGDKKYVMISDEEAKDFMLERGGSTLFVQTIDADGNPVANSFEPLRAAHVKSGNYGVSYDDFDLVYPGTDRTSGKKLSEQWRTMRLVGDKADKGLKNTKIYVYEATLDNGNGGYKSVSEIDETGIQDIKEKLYSTYGVLEKFQTGKAYFNVPLKHIWKANVSSNEFDPKTIVLGDYGVVRNHIYDLTINSIKGLGTGIGEIDQPIVPPTDNEHYFISTRLRILQWRAVKQNVDL